VHPKGGNIGILSEIIFGGDKEEHKDGSVTERFSDGQSVTRESDGSVRESSRVESRYPLLPGPWVDKVTRDGEGNIINVQPIED